MLITFLNKPKLIRLHSVKLFQVLLSIANNLIKHQLFVYTQLNDWIVPFQTIQFSISYLFALSLNVKSINRTLSGTTTLGQSGPGSDGNKGILDNPQSFNIYWKLVIRLFSVIFRTLVGGGFTPLQRCCWCILQPQLTRLEEFGEIRINYLKEEWEVI